MRPHKQEMECFDSWVVPCSWNCFLVWVFFWGRGGGEEVGGLESAAENRINCGSYPEL